LSTIFPEFLNLDLLQSRSRLGARRFTAPTPHPLFSTFFFLSQHSQPTQQKNPQKYRHHRPQRLEHHQVPRQFPVGVHAPGHVIRRHRCR